MNGDIKILSKPYKIEGKKVNKIYYITFLGLLNNKKMIFICSYNYMSHYILCYSLNSAELLKKSFSYIKHEEQLNIILEKRFNLKNNIIKSNNIVIMK